MKNLILAALAALVMSNLSYATEIADQGIQPEATRDNHSGGTDKNGCHAGKKPYHCH